MSEMMRSAKQRQLEMTRRTDGKSHFASKRKERERGTHLTPMFQETSKRKEERRKKEKRSRGKKNIHILPSWIS